MLRTQRRASRARLMRGVSVWNCGVGSCAGWRMGRRLRRPPVCAHGIGTRTVLDAGLRECSRRKNQPCGPPSAPPRVPEKVVQHGLLLTNTSNPAGMRSPRNNVLMPQPTYYLSPRSANDVHALRAMQTEVLRYERDRLLTHKSMVHALTRQRAMHECEIDKNYQHQHQEPPRSLFFFDPSASQWSLAVQCEQLVAALRQLHGSCGMAMGIITIQALVQPWGGKQHRRRPICQQKAASP